MPDGYWIIVVTACVACRIHPSFNTGASMCNKPVICFFISIAYVLVAVVIPCFVLRHILLITISKENERPKTLEKSLVAQLIQLCSVVIQNAVVRFAGCLPFDRDSGFWFYETPTTLHASMKIATAMRIELIYSYQTLLDQFTGRLFITFCLRISVNKPLCHVKAILIERILGHIGQGISTRFNG